MTVGILNGVCHVMKIITAESDPAIVLFTQQTFCFTLLVLARVSKMPVMTMSAASDVS